MRIADPLPFIPLEAMLLDLELELWHDLGSTALLGYLAHRVTHQQFTSSVGLHGQDAIQAKHRQSYFASEERLGQRVGLSASSIKRVNPLLCAVGLLKIVKQGGKGSPNTYRLPQVTPELLAEAVRKAKGLPARSGRRDPNHGSQGPEDRVSVTRTTGQADPLSRSEIEKRNREVKSISPLQIIDVKNPPQNPQDARRLIYEWTDRLAKAKGFPRSAR